jgi:undecaprenyl-diphosphatase
MDFITQLDADLFHLVNSSLTSPVLDAVMPYVTEKFNFLGAIIVAAILIVALGKRQDRVGLLVLVVLVFASDFVCAELKDLFERVRPCNAMDVRLLVGCGKSYSFPSGHATNIFSAMVFLTIRYRRFAPLFLLIATAVAYSRVYVGVHYPLDVLGGAVLGTSMAFVFTEGEKRVTRFISERRGRESVDEEL